MKVKIFSRVNIRDLDAFNEKINEFIKDKDVKFVKQSESTNTNARQNITISIWYEENSDKETKFQSRETWEGRCNG